MNILYISHLTEIKSQGPNVSVPEQVSAQEKYDNVFWYNLTQAKQTHWLTTNLFHNINEFPTKKIKDLPFPFNHPDLVVFESFYYMDDVKIAYQCRKSKIPYIIVPRSALTRVGQKQKRYKKIPANILFFKKMAKKAIAIQYLTESEYVNSGGKWNNNFLIIPNGVQPASKIKKWDKCGLKGVYIGRFDPFQKGLDLLLSACDILKKELEQNNVEIIMYGPERKGWKKKIINIIKERSLDNILYVKDGVFGEEKKKVLLDADFFLMTSRFEGHPMSLIEALSYGLPVFATKGTNMTNEIENYHAGWTCDNTVDDIVKTLKKIILDKERFPKFSENSLKLSKKYNWDVLANKSHEEYLKILGKK